MISVLTATYQRKDILQEAMQSFLLQDYNDDCEMIIINDCPDVKYFCNNNKFRIINSGTRFSSIGKKIEYGFKQCKFDYIFRLDDDDLLLPWSLSLSARYIRENPGYDIYSGHNHYYFSENKFVWEFSSVNNGNIYKKSYITNISIENQNFGEDFDMNNRPGVKKFKIPIESKNIMIYRWGMNTYHLSGMGDIGKQKSYDWVDRIVQKEVGNIELIPQFKQEDYYTQIAEYNENKHFGLQRV